MAKHKPHKPICKTPTMAELNAMQQSGPINSPYVPPARPQPQQIHIRIDGQEIVAIFEIAFKCVLQKSQITQDGVDLLLRVGERNGWIRKNQPEETLGDRLQQAIEQAKQRDEARRLAENPPAQAILPAEVIDVPLAARPGYQGQLDMIHKYAGMLGAA